MVLLIEIESRDESGDLVCVNQNSIFVVGYGGFGGPRDSEHTIQAAKTPDRVPDKVLKRSPGVGLSLFPCNITHYRCLSPHEAGAGGENTIRHSTSRIATHESNHRGSISVWARTRKYS